MWFLYTMECFLSHKNEVMSFVRNWMQLETITLSKLSQYEKKKKASLSFVVPVFYIVSYK